MLSLIKRLMGLGQARAVRQEQELQATLQAIRHSRPREVVPVPPHLFSHPLVLQALRQRQQELSRKTGSRKSTAWRKKTDRSTPKPVRAS